MAYKQLLVLILYFVREAFFFDIKELKPGEKFPFTKVRSSQLTKPKLVLDNIEVNVKNGKTTITVAMKKYNDDDHQVRDYSWYVNDLPIGPGTESITYKEKDEVKLVDPDFKARNMLFSSKRKDSPNGRAQYEIVRFIMYTTKPLKTIKNKTFKLFVRFRKADILLAPSEYFFFHLDTRHLLTIKGSDLDYPDEGSSKCRFDQLRYSLERRSQSNYKSMFKFDKGEISKINKVFTSFEGFNMTKDPPSHVQLYDGTNAVKDGSSMLRIVNQLSTQKKTIADIALSEDLTQDHLGIFMIGADATSNCYNINLKLGFDFTQFVYREKSFFPSSAIQITHFEQISDGQKTALVCRVLGVTRTDVSLYRKTEEDSTKVKLTNNVHMTYQEMVITKTFVFNTENERKSGTYFCLANYHGGPEKNTVRKSLNVLFY